MKPFPYVPLWCKSNSSFLEGASHPEELVSAAAFLGLPAIAISDRNGVYGLARAHERCRDLEGCVRLICGAQVSLSVAGEPSAETLVLLAETLDGWKALCRGLTLGARRSAKGENSLSPEEVARIGQGGGLLALWGGATSSLCADDERLWRAQGRLWKEAFGDRLYAVMARHRTPKDTLWDARTQQRAQRMDVPLLACREVLYHQPSRRCLQDVLTCIRHGRPLSQAGRLLKPNSDYALLSATNFAELYQDRPEAIRRTWEVAERCRFGLSQLRYRYPATIGPDEKSSAQWLRELAFEGAHKTYGDGQNWLEAEAQLNKELDIILQLDYVGYFLTMYEIVQFCRGRGILCQGRGSAANSIVCFCLGITAVDPIKLGLLFERFISVERAEPPDIDLDIMHQRREEVIAWVYQRYGREKAAMVCNVVRYRPRSAVREVGKVLQVETPVIERLARLLSGFSSSLEETVLEAAGLPQDVPLYRTLLRLVNEILDFPRHLSVHPGGFLLGSEPLCELVPIENATMPGRTVIQWDKYDVEALGLFKVDLLGLGALSQLDRAFRLLKEHRGLELSMESIPVDDEATFDLLCRGDSVGIFQVESRAQMSMLPTMRPRCFYDLVIQIAIIRPGPITGGMVHPYLRRRVGQETVDYPHPSLQPVLQKTLGIPLFQEQVMRLAVVVADYTPGEADQLRRDMAAWSSRGKLERHREKLLDRMVAKGIEPEFAERIFEQIKGFGEYGFPESHSASFALITYATSYLRCHYIAEFTCALLNSLPMGFYSASTLLEDAKRKGVTIRPFCAETSQWECSLEALVPVRGQQLELPGLLESGLLREKPSQEYAPLVESQGRTPGSPFAIRLGLKFMKGLSQATAQRLVERRPFRSIRELTVKADVERRALEILASGGALEVYGRSRRSALWSVDDHQGARALPLLADWDEQPREFNALSEDEEVVWDFEVASLSARGHPMRALRPSLRKDGFLDARTAQRRPHASWAKVAAMVICRQRPATAKGTVFLTLEDETGFVNVILWPKVFEANFVVARSAGLLAVEGQIQSARGVVHLVARKLYRPVLPTPVKVASRNFH